ncbi:hypothetical protein [Roseateles sp.]|nr:hypothetical protein [Roseateles sp.]MBV8036929.1 hypothetical protein [Roseateles sp.]
MKAVDRLYTRFAEPPQVIDKANVFFMARKLHSPTSAGISDLAKEAR